MALYPPIIASSMPAFDVTRGSVRIYFTLSDYNSINIDNIKKVQMTVRRQSSNVNVLLSTRQIIQKDFFQEEQDIPNKRYYVILNQSELVNGKFVTDALYKVQLRFCTKAAPESTSQLSTYYNNTDYFSEWSTVCIIKGIVPPTFYIDEFYVEGETPRETDINNFSYNLADFTGIFKQQSPHTTTDSAGNTVHLVSSQTLKNWRLRLLSSAFSRDQMSDIQTYTLADSGTNIISSYNYTVDTTSVVFECSLATELEQGSTYKLLFEIQTRNGYTDSLLYSFIFQPQSISALSGTLSAVINEEEGYIKLKYNSADTYLGNAVLRRSSAKDNFLKWEDLKNFEFHGTNSFEYYDFTAQSGMMYRYLIQKRDKYGRRGTPLYSENYILGQWEHAFLLQSSDSYSLDGVQQLKLKFDFQISSYKTNVSESRTDTIGSKYPYIRRNGNMYYRSFPCTGTITAYMDNTDLFTSSEQLFEDNEKYLKGWQKFQGNYDYWIKRYDYTYERKFREKVEEFLYNAKPKLYKSMQQGNILIKLMDVSLTPKNELGRLVYTFSATAYQIDEYSIKNLDNYGFINIGTYNPQVSYSDIRLSQANSYVDDQHPYGNLFKAGENILTSTNSIGTKLNYNKAINNQKVTSFKITWLRIQVESEPYLIKQVRTPEGIKFVPVDDIIDKSYDIISKPINNQLYQIQSTYNSQNIYLGTLFEIDGEQIIISPPNNIYELKDQGVNFTQKSVIKPAKDTALTVDFVAELTIEEDTSKVPKIIRTDSINGQLVGPFAYDTDLISQINYQYKQNFQDTDRNQVIKQHISGVKTVNIDTQPGTIVEIKTSAQQITQSAYTIIVNETGELFFDPGDPTYYIKNFKIKGQKFHLEDFIDRRNEEYYSLENIQYPVNMNLYSIQVFTSGQHGQSVFIPEDYVYYKRHFYRAFQQQDGTINVQCPVEALLFYFADIRRDIY